MVSVIQGSWMYCKKGERCEIESDTEVKPNVVTYTACLNILAKRRHPDIVIEEVISCPEINVRFIGVLYLGYSLHFFRKLALPIFIL